MWRDVGGMHAWCLYNCIVCTVNPIPVYTWVCLFGAYISRDSLKLNCTILIFGCCIMRDVFALKTRRVTNIVLVLCMAYIDDILKISKTAPIGIG